MVIESSDRIVAVVEVKLLAALGDGQLERYFHYVTEPHREDCRFVTISLDRLRLNTEHAAGWANLTWEDVLTSFASSSDPWVAATASAWLRHIDSQVPVVNSSTPWNQVDGTDLYLALRLRAAYIYDHVTVPDGSCKSLREIGSGGLYVAIVDAPIPDSSYTVRWEVTEHLPTQDVGRLIDGAGLGGPEIRFRLVQQRVTSSRAYDWTHLHLLWTTYLASETWIPWRPFQPRKRLRWEMDGVALLRELGSPVFLGGGFGERQAKLSGEVEFGACFVLPPSTSVAETTDILSRVARIGSRMARHAVPPRGSARVVTEDEAAMIGHDAIHDR